METGRRQREQSKANDADGKSLDKKELGNSPDPDKNNDRESQKPEEQKSRDSSGKEQLQKNRDEVARDQKPHRIDAKEGSERDRENQPGMVERNQHEPQTDPVSGKKMERESLTGGEKNTERERQSLGEQMKQESRSEEKGKNPSRDETDNRRESTTPPQLPTSGFQKKSDAEQPGSEQQDKKPALPSERPMDTNSTEGVTRLEQLERSAIPDQRSPEPNEKPFGSLDQASRQSGPGISDELAKEWMNRVEADPGQLLRRQFEVEERRELRQSVGPLMEARPW
ncbi:hypothetical protein CCP3SC5AM1_1300002 [Gammaproteobacteria bacterium]